MTNREPYPNVEPGLVEPAPADRSSPRAEAQWLPLGAVVTALVRRFALRGPHGLAR